MTWDITIGKIVRDEDSETDSVERESHPASPVFPGDEVVNYQRNTRGLNYSYVDEFLKAADLSDWAYLEGTYSLTNERYLQMRAALTRYRALHPTAVAGWGEEYDDILARLEWMDWWAYYALSKYKKAAGINIWI